MLDEADGLQKAAVRAGFQAERLQERERAAGRPLLTPEQLEDRLESQMPNEEKARRATHVVRTDVPLTETQARVRELWQDLTGER